MTITVPTNKRVLPAAVREAMDQGVPLRHAMAGAKAAATGARVKVGGK